MGNPLSAQLPGRVIAFDGEHILIVTGESTGSTHSVALYAVEA